MRYQTHETSSVPRTWRTCTQHGRQHRELGRAGRGLRHCGKGTQFAHHVEGVLLPVRVLASIGILTLDHLQTCSFNLAKGSDHKQPTRTSSEPIIDSTVSSQLSSSVRAPIKTTTCRTGTNVCRHVGGTRSGRESAGDGRTWGEAHTCSSFLYAALISFMRISHSPRFPSSFLSGCLQARPRALSSGAKLACS